MNTEYIQDTYLWSGTIAMEVPITKQSLWAMGPEHVPWAVNNTWGSEYNFVMVGPVINKFVKVSDGYFVKYIICIS